MKARYEMEIDPLALQRARDNFSRAPQGDKDRGFCPVCGGWGGALNTEYDSQKIHPYENPCHGD